MSGSRLNLGEYDTLMFIERGWVVNGGGRLDKLDSREAGLDTAYERGVWCFVYSKNVRIA